MANMDQVEENVPVSQVHGLIKQKRNAELKSLLLQEVPSTSINKQDSTLIHTAVMFNNIDVIALLLGLGFNIDARNSIDQTPLLLAAQNNSYRAVQLLLTLDADVFVDDDKGANALRVLLQDKTTTPTHIIGSLFDRLQRSELSSSEFVDQLVKANCPLEHVLMLNDAKITREMLIRTNEQDEDTLLALLKRAMYTMDMENARVFLEYKPHLDTRRKTFFDEVTKNIFDPTTKPFFEQLVKWKAIDEECMGCIKEWFRFSLTGHEELDKDLDEDDIQMFLDIGIDKYCREKFGYELLVSLFANDQINVLKLVKNRQLDVNSRDENGNTLLHAAARRDMESTAYLLDIGADPNIKNSKGRTPLFYAVGKRGVGELLLEAGADLQAVDKGGSCAFDELELWDIVKVELLILEFRGLLNNKIHKWLYEIDSSGVPNEELQELYGPYTQDLAWMNTRMVSESINLFTVLTEKFDRLARYVKDEKTCTEIRNAATGERKLQEEFSEMLIKKLNKACKMNELKSKAAKFLCDKMQITDCDHLVIEKIIGFLTYKNLLVFEEMEEV